MGNLLLLLASAFIGWLAAADAYSFLIAMPQVLHGSHPQVCTWKPPSFLVEVN
jgi:hypothetical protein